MNLYLQASHPFPLLRDQRGDGTGAADRSLRDVVVNLLAQRRKCLAAPDVAHRLMRQIADHPIAVIIVTARVDRAIGVDHHRSPHNRAIMPHLHFRDNPAIR